MNVPSFFSEQPPPSDPEQEVATTRRMFVFESGWRAGVKTGSTRELCYMMAPGQDFYHRLLDGEIFLVRDGERLCLSCAHRRGLISFGPKQLRDAIVPVPIDGEVLPLEVDWRDAKQISG
jgi:hypothetical protein